MQMVLVALNAAGLLFLTITSMIYFLDENMHDGVHTSTFHAFDVALPNAAATAAAVIALVVVSVRPFRVTD